MTLKHIFGRRRTSGTECKVETGKTSTNGAHELFLEYEGFLSPPNPRRQRPSTPNGRPVHAQTSTGHHESKRSSVIYAPRGTDVVCGIPRESSHGLVDENHSRHNRTPSRNKKGLFSFSRTTRSGSSDCPPKPTRVTPSQGYEPRSVDRIPHSGWLQKCLSTRLQGHQPSLDSSLTALPPYNEPLAFDDEKLTALPSLPGYENEPPMAPDRSASGAAARAAAAAQNEVIENMRNLRLAEPKLSRDSESGVGIEIRDRGEAITDLDVPVIRKGKAANLVIEALLTDFYCRSAECTTRRTRRTNSVLSGCRIID